MSLLSAARGVAYDSCEDCEAMRIAALKAAIAATEARQAECKHGYEETVSDGPSTFRRFQGPYCRDCGQPLKEQPHD